MTSIDLKDSQKKFLRDNFRPDGSQKYRIRTTSMMGNSSPLAGTGYKLVSLGVLNNEPTKNHGCVSFSVKEEYRYLITEAPPVVLSKNMVAVLDFIEANGGGPFSAKEMEPEKWRPDVPREERDMRTGLGAPSIKSNCDKLVGYGLLSKSKKGRSFVWTRTEQERPETAEQRKERLEQERLEKMRKAGKAHVCQGCLRVIEINDTGSFGQQDMVCRHGWQNLGGWHTEGCLGWNNLPLEEDYKVAKRVVDSHVRTVKVELETLAELAERPTFKMTRATWEKWGRTKREEKPEEAHETVEVKPGDKFKGRYDVTNSYEKVLATHVSRSKTNLRHLAHNLDLFAMRVPEFHSDEGSKALVESAEKASEKAREGSK